ncbi:MAG: fumarate reductase subunit FrdD [Pseudomonadales bacterium]
MKARTHEPIFWSLFGAGGVVVAFVLPMLIFITGIATPMGWLPDDALSYDRVSAIVASWPGKLFFFLVISLCLWHGVHRIFLSLHDFGIEKRNWQRWLLYGSAGLGTVVSGVLVLLIQGP